MKMCFLVEVEMDPAREPFVRDLLMQAVRIARHNGSVYKGRTADHVPAYPWKYVLPKDRGGFEDSMAGPGPPVDPFEGTPEAEVNRLLGSGK